MTSLTRQIKHLRAVLEERQANLNYWQEQAASYGALDIPLPLHNRIMAEQREIEARQTELQALLNRQAALRAPGEEAENIPAMMIVEDDIHWRDIFIGVAATLGCQARTFTPRELVAQAEAITARRHHLSVIGLPTPESLGGSFALAGWTRAILNLSQVAPVILLSTPQADPVSIATRQRLRENNLEVVATIQKETFDHDWFIKLCQQALAI